jgi:hypothetical protein
MVVTGAAKLAFEDRVVELLPGDYDQHPRPPKAPG